MWGLIDIGGTSIKCVLVEPKQELDPTLKALWQHRWPSSKGIEVFTDSIKQLKQAMLKECAAFGKQLEAVSIGFPANMSLDESKTILRGAAPNLSLFQGEWDGISMQAFFEEQFEGIKVRVVNDAVAQCLGGVVQYYQQHIKASKKFGFMGIGTGLGGAFCCTDSLGVASFYTDGHIYDFCIQGPNQKMGLAEDFISGRGFQSLYGIDAQHAQNSQGFEEYKPIWKDFGKRINMFLMELKQGHLQKSPRPWPQEDIKAIQDVEQWLIGGSFAKVSKARDYWLSFVDVVPVWCLEQPDEAAFLGLYEGLTCI